MTEDDDAEAACGRNRSRERRNKPNPKREADERNDDPATESKSGSGSDMESERTREILKNLPKLDGINYQMVKAADGQTCIIATGHTAARKELLTGTGFRWNSERKIWWKYAA